MRHAIQIKKPAKQEVVADETVPYVFTTDYGFERYLKPRKHHFQKFNELVGRLDAPAVHAANVRANRQKLFLHKSVSRTKPSALLLDKWVLKLQHSPKFVLQSGCVITLIQPRTKRPGRTFYNSDKPRTKTPYNDGLSYSAIVLLANKMEPQNEYDEASHLCGHSRCVNVHHLVWEPIGKNSSRNECHHYNTSCNHTPPCIGFNPDDALLVKQRLQNEREKKLAKKPKYNK